MAAIRGDPEIKKAVTGAMILIISPLHNPTASTAIMIVVLTMGPVKYTERFLKNWLAIHMARSNAVCINCLVEIFISPPFISLLRGTVDFKLFRCILSR